WIAQDMGTALTRRRSRIAWLPYSNRSAKKNKTLNYKRNKKTKRNFVSFCLISPFPPRLSVLPPKREPASSHRWCNKILLMRLSGAHHGVRRVNDNEYSNRQRD